MDHKVHKLHQQLHEAERRYQKLKNAIPKLPSPEKLYDEIISLCIEHRSIILTISSIESSVKSFIVAQGAQMERLSELERLEFRCANIRLQLLFNRSQLRTLFSVPPILIALGQISKQGWHNLLDQPQMFQGKMLVVDQEIIESITTDQLVAIGSMQLQLQEQRLQLEKEKNEEFCLFEEHVKNTLTHLHKLSTESKDAIATVLQAIDKLATTQDREKEIIENNAECLEGIDSMDEGQNTENNTEDEPATDQSERSSPRKDSNHPPDRREQLESEIRKTKQSLANLEEIMRELEEERTCPPRNFNAGRISRYQEKFMRCAFCFAVGTHFSDSCPHVRNVDERRYRIARDNRCELCLESICRKGQFCKKFFQKCHHCSRSGHHSSLCDLPERSIVIRQRLEQARSSWQQCKNRLIHLHRDLQQL
ncbi:hypothetical protein Q1695_005071 [Nippostrongylus brasiliensis]|nr:hypothetical protein Q1695_005071 [Nippostrongylus brasiliensis]